MNRRSTLLTLAGVLSSGAGCSALQRTSQPTPSRSSDAGASDLSKASLRVQTPSGTEYFGLYRLDGRSEDGSNTDSMEIAATAPLIRHDVIPVSRSERWEYTIDATVHRGDERVTTDHSVSFSPSDEQQALVVTVTAPTDVSITTETL
jgi:hypothetical protein